MVRNKIIAIILLKFSKWSIVIVGKMRQLSAFWFYNRSSHVFESVSQEQEIGSEQWCTAHPSYGWVQLGFSIALIIRLSSFWDAVILKMFTLQETAAIRPINYHDRYLSHKLSAWTQPNSRDPYQHDQIIQFPIHESINTPILPLSYAIILHPYSRSSGALLFRWHIPLALLRVPTSHAAYILLSSQHGCPK